MIGNPAVQNFDAGQGFILAFIGCLFILMQYYHTTFTPGGAESDIF